MKDQVGDTVIFKLPALHVGEGTRDRAAMVTNVQKNGSRDLTVFLVMGDTDQGMAVTRFYPGIKLGPGLWQYSVRA